MLHASECYAPLVCHVKATELVSNNSLCARLQIPPLNVALHEKRLRSFVHVKRSSTWINKAHIPKVDGTAGKGRPRKTWTATIKEDLKA